MNLAEHSLEFDKVKEKWSEFAYTEWAKEEIRNTIPMMEESKLATKQRETSEARILLEKGGTPPLTALTEIRELLDISEKGGCLNGQQLEQVEATLAAVKRLKDYLNRCKQFEVSLAYYEENLQELAAVREMIHLQIRNGAVDTNASKLLKMLRSDIEKAECKMREKAELVLKSHKEYMSDSFSTIRNGHVCIPVKKEYKFKISGSVIDKSATGNTLFIEPAQVAKYYEELQMLKIDEENEERRILYTLTAMVADVSEEMRENMKFMEKLDFIFSKGKLSLECDGTEPSINMERKIVLKNARHPLMDKNVCVPLQFEIGDGVSGIVITGPNTGGKTVAIKTVALNCMMAQCGLHVTCTEATICMNSNFLCDIGDGQNIAENLSTFSAHITNVLNILKQVNADSLVIMDELGSGTDPAEGMGIAIAILQELKKSGALFLVTTHYPEVKEYAEQEKEILNARMTFDKESLRPLYQLVLGEAGESCAFYIAQKLGMPQSMLRCAVQAAYGKEKAENYRFENASEELEKESTARLKKKNNTKKSLRKVETYQLGDSVMVYPDKKIGIVCETANEKGILRIQLPKKKIWINHKRVKLLVAAEKLYPEDYDFSIIFDTVEHRKLRHKMDRKYVEGETLHFS